jgi:3-oxoadipate enol-lactonase
MTTLHYLREGQGPVIVLSHALGCDLHMWDGVAAVLCEHFTVLRYDHRGHGQSMAPHTPWTVHDMADDVHALITHQAKEPVHFVGLSLGGMVAQSLAARYPGVVRSVVIANSALHYDNDAKAMWQARIKMVLQDGMSAIADGAMQRWFTPAFRVDAAGGGQARVATMRHTLVSTNATAYAHNCAAVAGIDFRASNAKIKCPTLVLGGDLDEATPVAMARAVCQSITAARLHNMATAHLSAVEQPNAFAAQVSAFAS